MAVANPWDPVSEPNAAGMLLSHFLASGTVTQVCVGGALASLMGVSTGSTEEDCEVGRPAAGVTVWLPPQVLLEFALRGPSAAASARAA